MPYGSLYFGKDGFFYKNAGGGGGKKNPPLGLLNCSSTTFYNDYIPGSGVGASSIATRRSKLIKATKCTVEYPCNKGFAKLGLYAGGGSNQNGLNWFIGTNDSPYDRIPTPAPTTVPSPPLNVTAASNNPDEATVSFSPPTSNGGSAILSYTVSVTSIPDLDIAPVTGTSSPITISNLPPNIPYTFTVTATNAIGDSEPSSSSQTVTPSPFGSTTEEFKVTGSTTWTAPNTVTSLEYLIVGGGGGGGGAYDNSAGGGGGGGLVLDGSMSVVPGQTYIVIVGAGGAGAVRPTYVSSPVTGQNNGSPGEKSSFYTIDASGGGFGYKSRTAAPGASAATGGLIASGIIPPTGGNGGTGGSQLGGGGGGGNTSNGSTATTATGASGGTGASSSITGTSSSYGAGGNGGTRGTGAGSAGANNTGNGGQGGGSESGNNIGGANGGSGIVIIKYYY
jgi:hypothetical protein